MTAKNLEDALGVSRARLDETYEKGRAHEAGRGHE